MDKIPFAERRHPGSRAEGVSAPRTMPEFVLGRLTEALNDRGKPLRGARVLDLGVAYKPEVGDVRESPALHIIDALLRRGAHVEYADPFVPTLSVGEARLESACVNRELPRWSDAEVILTDHRAFDYGLVAREAPLVVDTRHPIARGAQRT